jgi:F-type H+-transporting ATPase subunit epsilon
MPIAIEIVTAERSLLQDSVDMVIAPSVEGVLGILPRHAPLVAILKPGELRLKKGAEETHYAVSGGILQVEPDKVIVLADAAEHAEEIDEARARAAMEEARRRMAEVKDHSELEVARAAMEREAVRLRVAERRRRVHHVSELPESRDT